MKLVLAAMCFATVGLFSFKENKIVKNNSAVKQIVPTDGRYFDNLVDTGGKKRDTTTIPPTGIMDNAVDTGGKKRDTTSVPPNGNMQLQQLSYNSSK